MRPDLVESQTQVYSERWQAGIDIELTALDGCTRMGRTRHYGPLRIQRPFWPEGKDLTHLYILHPPGGLVAGDELIQTFTVRSDASGLITTPAAGKVYFNGNGRLQIQKTQLKAANNASIEWLPQETIIYNGAVAQLDTVVELEGSGQYAGWEIVCLGRKASGESFKQGNLLQKLKLNRDGLPLFQERFELKASSSTQFSQLGLKAHHVFGTFLVTLDESPDCESLHESLVEKGWHHHTALTWRNGVLIIRYLGDSPEQVRTIFTDLWQKIRPEFNGREACMPRIWNT